MDILATIKKKGLSGTSLRIYDLLIAVIGWTSSKDKKSFGLLETIYEDNESYPQYMAEMAIFFLSKEPEYKFSNMISEYDSFEELVVMTIDRYNVKEFNQEIFEELVEYFRKNPTSKVAPFIGLLNIYIGKEFLNETKLSELIEEYISNYPGSKYEAKSVTLQLEIIRETIRRLSSEISNSLDDSRKNFLKDRVTSYLKKIEKKLEYLLERYKFIEFVRIEVIKNSELIYSLNLKKDYIKFLDKYSRLLSDYKEGVYLHMKIAMYMSKDGTPDEANYYAVEHIKKFPDSIFKKQMQFIQANYLLNYGDKYIALNILKELIEGDDPKWVDLASNEVIVWVKSQRNLMKESEYAKILEYAKKIPLDREKKSELIYLHCEILKSIAANSSSQERSKIIDRVIFMLEDICKNYSDTYHSQLAENSLEEIKSGKFENDINVNKYSRIIILIAIILYITFSIYTFLYFPWLFWGQLVSTVFVIVMWVIFKYMDVF